MRRRFAFVVLLLATLATLGALATCSPYDPSLPDKPFLCNDEEPRCPDGYTCMAEPSGTQVCGKPGATDDANLGSDAP